VAQVSGNFVLASMVFAAVGVFLLASVSLKGLESLRRIVRLQKRLLVVEEHDAVSFFSGKLVQLTKGLSLPFCTFLGAHPFLGRPARYLSDACICAGIQCEVRSVQSLLFVLVGVGMLTGFLLSSSLAVAMLGGTACLLLVMFDAGHSMKKRARTMREQLPGMLQSLKTALGAGRSLSQSLSYTAKNTAAPLGDELKKVVWDIEAGKDVAEALGAFEQRTAIPELIFVSMALVIQQRTGGSMRPIFDSAQDAVRASIELRRSLQVQTAQGRFSARVVGVMPLCLLGALALISPGYISGFFTSALGVFLFCIALILDGVGLLLIRKILVIRSE
jgi:Flp pilus assembly protein TadB